MKLIFLDFIALLNFLYIISSYNVFGSEPIRLKDAKNERFLVTSTDNSNHHHPAHSSFHHSPHHKHHSHQKSIQNSMQSLHFKRRRHGGKHNGYKHKHAVKNKSLTINRDNDALKINTDNLSMKNHLENKDKIEKNLEKRLNGKIITKKPVINGHINKIDGFINGKTDKNKHNADKAKNYNDNNDSKSTKYKKNKKQKVSNKDKKIRNKKILNHKNKTNHNDNTEIRIFRSAHSHRAHYPFNETRQHANISTGDMKSHSISNKRYRNENYRKKYRKNIITLEKRKSVLKEGIMKKDYEKKNIALTGYDEIKMKKSKTKNLKNHHYEEKQKFHKKRHLNEKNNLKEDKFVDNMASKAKKRNANIDEDSYWNAYDDSSFSDDEENDAGSGFEESLRADVHEKTNLFNYDHSYEDIGDEDDVEPDIEDPKEEEYEKLREEEEEAFKKYRSTSNHHSTNTRDYDSDGFHAEHDEENPANKRNSIVRETKLEYLNLSDEAISGNFNNIKTQEETKKQITENFLSCFHKLRNVVSNHMRTLKQEEDDVVGDINLCNDMGKVFESCQEMLEKGEELDNHHLQNFETFATVWKALYTICHDKVPSSSEAKETLETMMHCVEAEARGSLSLRCDEYYFFNLDQKTRDKCFFIGEKFKCQESLLISACRHLFPPEISRHNPDNSDWSVDQNHHTRHQFNRQSHHNGNFKPSFNQSPNAKYKSNNEYVYVHYPNHNDTIPNNENANKNDNNINNYGAVSVFNLANDTDYNTPYSYDDSMHFRKSYHNFKTSDVFSFPKFIYHLLLLTHDKIINVNNCTVLAQDPKYNRVFQYESPSDSTNKPDDRSTKCFPGFSYRLEQCTIEHFPKEQILHFSTDNDLISTGTVGDVTGLCGVFEDFLNCMRGFMKSCPKGVSLFLQYEYNLHKYMIKMGFICDSKNFQAYLSSLSCLQEIVEEKQLATCDVHWKRIEPSLKKLSAVNFYCNPNNKALQKLSKHMDRLLDCQGEIFEQKCGRDVREMMVNFIKKALRSPLYLRFGYEPDCELHGIETSNTGNNEGSDVFHTFDLGKFFNNSVVAKETESKRYEDKEVTSVPPIQKPHDHNLDHQQFNEYGQTPDNFEAENNYNTEDKFHDKNNNFPYNSYDKSTYNKDPYFKNHHHNNNTNVHEQQPFNFHNPPTESETKNMPKNSSPNSSIFNLHFLSIVFYMIFNI